MIKLTTLGSVSETVLHLCDTIFMLYDIDGQHHQPHSLADHRGTTQLATSFHHPLGLSVLVTASLTVRPVHSEMLFSFFFFFVVR